jgi:hypothetical protein
MLAALGTCRRFADDNPTTRDVRILSASRVVAVFAPEPARPIRSGMLAVSSVGGESRKYEGRVLEVRRTGGVLEVECDFPSGLPKGGTGATGATRLSVDTSIPPEALRQ